MENQFNSEAQNNSNNNDQPLVSLVNLISDNLNNANMSNNNNSENSSLSSNKINNSNKNKNDDLLLEIDAIIGKDNMDHILPVSSNNTPSETSTLNSSKSSNQVEIKENHFINKNQSQNNIYKNSYTIPFELSEETLNEPILTTIYRDLYLVYTKLKFVINPYTSNEVKSYHIKQWDLWGPLLLVVFLSCTLAVNATDKSQTVILVFFIFWLGSFLVFLNAHLLGVKTSIFQMFCLLGYCLFPLNVSAFILSFTKLFDIFRFIIVAITCAWSLYSASSFLQNLSMPEQRYLVLYPSILLYIYIAWFIFVTKH